MNDNRYGITDNLNKSPFESLFLGLRFVGALFGMMMILIAFYFAIGLFNHIYSILKNPDGITKRIDSWEKVVKGAEAPIVREVEKKMQESDDRIANAARFDDRGEDGNNTKKEVPDKDEKSVEKKTSELDKYLAIKEQEKMLVLDIVKGAKVARYAAIFFILYILSLLTRLAVLFVNAGANLLDLSTEDKRLMKKILKEVVLMRRHPASNSSGEGANKTSN